MNKVHVQICIWVGTMCSLPMSVLTKNVKTTPAHDEDCHVTEEKKLLQSSGRVQNQMVSAVDSTWKPNIKNNGGFIIQAPSGECVDIPGEKLENAKEGLQTWKCHEEWEKIKKTQGFWYKDSVIHPTASEHWCLDALEASEKTGEEAINTKVGLYPCNKQENQKFVIRSYITSEASGFIFAEKFGLCVDRNMTLQKCSQDTRFAMPGYQEFHGFQIRSNVGGNLCFDIPGQKIENDATLQMYPCHEKGKDDAIAQTFYYVRSDFTIRPVADVSKCLDATTKPEEGTDVVLWNCNGKAWQQWDLVTKPVGAGDTKIMLKKKSLGSFCIKDVSETYTKGKKLKVGQCSESSKVQLWGVLGFAIKSLDSKMCLDIFENKIVRNQKIIAWTCQTGGGSLPSDNQNFWYARDNTIRSVVGWDVEENKALCLDVAGGLENVKVGITQVALWYCNDKPNQKFIIGNDQIQLKEKPELCISDAKHTFSKGAVMTVTPCEAPPQEYPYPKEDHSNKRIQSGQSLKAKTFLTSNLDAKDGGGPLGIKDMSVPWNKTNSFPAPQCADGSVSWYCNQFGRGPRISCPAAWPLMCKHDKGCGGYNDTAAVERCCVTDRSVCHGDVLREVIR
mmetsp:Transcript_107013/g.207391  ORF Transcript_107013/g.207391 Transcript_107013/m.207391 type:complete len:618 (+) Transcript_107013:62-1915(+)